MKNKLTLMSFIFLLILSGCSKQTVNNDLFTDEFFSDIIEIRDMNGVEPVTGEQIEPVISYLQSLELTEVDQHLGTGEDQLGGPRLLTFIKSDGTEIVFLRTHGAITYTKGTEKCTYIIEEGNLNEGLKEAFNQGLNTQE